MFTTGDTFDSVHKINNKLLTIWDFSSSSNSHVLFDIKELTACPAIPTAPWTIFSRAAIIAWADCLLSITVAISGAYAIYSHSSYGPCFGHKADFGIYNECLGRNDNWCYNKSTYDFNNENMNGETSFNILDYEVYLVIFD